MAAGKEIRTKISSIRSTQKITSAMEMVAASKMRKAQDRMRLGKPYARDGCVQWWDILPMQRLNTSTCI